MKSCFTMLAATMVVTLTACTQFPIKLPIADDQVRFENFKRDSNQPVHSYVYLACKNSQLQGWNEPRKLNAGDHSLYIKAVTTHRNVPNSIKEAYATFDVTLEGGKSYMLNRELQNEDTMKVWIQEVDTGIGVGEVKTVHLDKPFNEETAKHRQSCASGTV